MGNLTDFIMEKAVEVLSIDSPSGFTARAADFVMNEYRNGYCKVVTSQLEYSFLYDNTVVKGEYNKSKIIEKKC